MLFAILQGISQLERNVGDVEEQQRYNETTQRRLMAELGTIRRKSVNCAVKLLFAASQLLIVDVIFTFYAL